jgi:hypothetical protein
LREESLKVRGEALDQSEVGIFLCSAMKLTCYYKKNYIKIINPKQLSAYTAQACPRLQARTHAIREREKPYAITSFWVFTLALFLSFCTKWLAKPDQYAANSTTIYLLLSGF